MTTYSVIHTRELPEYDKTFYVLPKAVKTIVSDFVPELTIDGMIAVHRLQGTKEDLYAVRSKSGSVSFCSVDLAHWFIAKDDQYDLMIMSVRPDGMPVSADERRLRRLLCSMHDPRSYMDDGEAQTTAGLDFMRSNMHELNTSMMEERHTKYVNQIKQLHEAGITTEEPFDPVHELDGVIADIQAGKPFDVICLRTIERVRAYISIVSSYGKKPGQI